MKERPILFSAPMVRALLNGTKTQTRRIVQKMPAIACPSVCRLLIEQHPFNPSAFTGTPAEGKIGGKDRLGWVAEDWVKNIIGAEELAWLSPKYGVPGDRLWVKETFSARGAFGDNGRKVYRATIPEGHLECHFRPWKPSIFCTRAASRITLEITAVRVERLNEISEADAKAEGIDSCNPSPLCNRAWRDYGQKRYDPFEWFTSPVESYRTLWESINGAGSWALNPWVWVIEFRRVQP